eukprot:TRINITY_DN12481_c0_g1_i1.p1 TRINITY_DN12481_c0_g1~~TRINITY_DN12481_c0_g1_i1.p1  ORF type:complete len:213 (+),score=40.70 TRINITY_DN12481_c0_g1_i1:25-639(+)
MASKAETKETKTEQAPYLKKIALKGRKTKPTEIEVSVAKALLELETNSKDLAVDLADIHIASAKEIEADKKKTIVVFVPFKLFGKFKKIHTRVVRELEKKLGAFVLILAQRTILSKNYSRGHKGEMRPRSRTLTAVHTAILEDIVFPTAIVGKRIKVSADNGKHLLKILLDPKDAKEYEAKLKVYQSVYTKLTHKDCEFLFPVD